MTALERNVWKFEKKTKNELRLSLNEENFLSAKNQIFAFTQTTPT